MIKLYSPKNEAEMALIKSLLGGEGIKYFIHNEHFGSLNVGPRIPLFNARTIMVHKEDIERAKELLSDFLKNTQQETQLAARSYSLTDKIRLFLEVLLFTWIIPGRKFKKTKLEEEKDKQ